jgi:hypothetical protein
MTFPDKGKPLIVEPLEVPQPEPAPAPPPAEPVPEPEKVPA